MLRIEPFLQVLSGLSRRARIVVTENARDVKEAQRITWLAVITLRYRRDSGFRNVNWSRTAVMFADTSASGDMRDCCPAQGHEPAKESPAEEKMMMKIGAMALLLRPIIDGMK